MTKSVDYDNKFLEKGLTLEFDLEVTKCPCGSGKKPTKCCGPVKPRRHSINMDERNYHESDDIAFNLNGGLMRRVNGELQPIIGQSRFSYGYEREKGQKVLLSGEANGDFVMNPESVLHGYEMIFAIDTNTKIIGGNKVSVSVIVHAYLEPTETGLDLNLAAITAFEFWNVTVSPERLGWYALINALLLNELLINKYTGIVVDSDLSDLEAINSQQKSILNDFLLPDKYKLIYASSDTGANGANKLIKLCDSRSNEILEHIRKNSKKDNLMASTEYPCEFFRQWQFNQ
jgi:hypothetical protein